jgi:sugar lactone lactonase YvrE
VKARFAQLRGRLLVLLCASVPAVAWAQSLPPIYERTPVELAPAQTLAEFAKGSFLENIAVDTQGRLFVTSYLDGKVFRVEADGQRSEWAQLPGTIAGIALNPDGSAVVSGWIGGKDPALFAVDAQGRGDVLVRLPEGQFPNGVVRLSPGRFLVADSYRGVIWAVDASTRSATLWLAHESLTRADPNNPTPGVNGLRIWNGALYASNTARQQLLRIPMADGAAGVPEVLRSQVALDDFAFDDQGTLYAATHVYNSLVRITPQGRISVIAGIAQGMAGSTAVAAVPVPGQGLRLYAVTNGGLSLPPPGGLQPARIVRVDIAPPR